MSTIQDKPKRIAIVPLGYGKLPLSALEFLVLRLNTLQSDIEFEFIPQINNHKFQDKYKAHKIINQEKFENEVIEYVNHLDIEIQKLNTGYHLPMITPDRYVFISLAKLNTEYYEIWRKKYSAIFVGDWKNVMAPPSLLEFLITLIIAEGIVAILADTEYKLSHLATRGCLGDFNAELVDIRYKVLQGYLCHDCRTAVEKNLGPIKTEEWISILRKEWIGKPSDPGSVADIVSKLGYDLFLTKGIEPTLWQKIKQLLREETTKELIKIIGGIILASILVWLGLKGKPVQPNPGFNPGPTAANKAPAAPSPQVLQR